MVENGNDDNNAGDRSCDFVGEGIEGSDIYLKEDELLQGKTYYFIILV